MVKQKNIVPQTITKPIQLLAAWLTGLVLVNGSFLSTAILIEKQTWAAGTLVIAAVLNVPIFLVALFLLQTKFRPEMQEDSFYHDYLVNKLGQSKEDSLTLRSFTQTIEPDSQGIWAGYKVLMNDSLPGSKQIRNSLQLAEIPVTGTFGGRGEPPSDQVVTIGRRFELDHLKMLITALKETEIKFVNFGADEDEVNQYDNTVLIGSYIYKPENNSMPIFECEAFLNHKEITAYDFYQAIFDAQRAEDD